MDPSPEDRGAANDEPNISDLMSSLSTKFDTLRLPSYHKRKKRNPPKRNFLPKLNHSVIVKDSAKKGELSKLSPKNPPS